MKEIRTGNVRGAPPTRIAPPTTAQRLKPSQWGPRAQLVGLVLCPVAILWIAHGILNFILALERAKAAPGGRGLSSNLLTVSCGPILFILGLLALVAGIDLWRRRRPAYTGVLLWAWLQMVFAVFFALGTWQVHVENTVRIAQAAAAMGLPGGLVRIGVFVALPLPFLWVSVCPFFVLLCLSRKSVEMAVRSWE